MLGLLIESWEGLKARGPRVFFVKKRHINFITIHYLYILFLAILGSVLLYSAGGLRYIDALFFASGCATQSGLNTVDINTLNTYQQVVFYLTAMVSTPIFVNTFVVFVRLFWFERRFQHIVRDAHSFRQDRSGAKSEAKKDADLERVERGVNGRNIVVLRDGNMERADDINVIKSEKPASLESESPASSSLTQGELAELQDQPSELPDHRTPSFHREITFADEISGQDSGHLPPVRLPQRLSPEQHIAFLENQRNPKDKGTLRIPGPREFDRGHVPETLNAEIDGGPLSQQITSPVEGKGVSSGIPVGRQVTIEEPEHHARRADTGLMPKILHRRIGTSDRTKASAPDEASLPSATSKSRTNTFGSLRDWSSKEKEPMPYLSWQPTIGRNSAFVDLTEEQREELGGIEYRSLKTLALVLVLYYALFHLLGLVLLLPWIVRSKTWGPVVDLNGQSRAWWGIFTPAAMFNNLGFTITADSMISFQKAVLPLLFGSFLIIIGNTGFPCMLRLVIWASSFIVPSKSSIWDELKFLLDHPRRCFTLLFPSQATWWLFGILFVLNGLDVILFIVLNLNDDVASQINSFGYRILNGLFQAASTRTAGFASVNLADLHPGIQVSYLIMMYISVFPIAISVRRTNVYEEKSLGIYGNASDEEEDEKEPSYVGAHLRRQLSFDLWYIFVGLFIIAIAEGRRIRNVNQPDFTTFSCLFEIVSAYGTVGLSLGYPETNASFSAQFTVVSKLVIIAMQIRGRHRGLPYALDRAILLPSESLHQKEDADASRRLPRRNSTLSNHRNQIGNALLRPSTLATTTGINSTHGLHGILEKTPTGHASHAGHTNPGMHSMHARNGLGAFMAEVAAQPKLRRRVSHPPSND